MTGWPKAEPIVRLELVRRGQPSTAMAVLSPAFAAESMTADRIGMLMGGVHHEHDGLEAGADRAA